MSSQNSNGVKVPGWWPGVLEFVSVLLFSFNSSIWAKMFREAEDADERNAATAIGNCGHIGPLHYLCLALQTTA
jgi:hypothetical protein